MNRLARDGTGEPVSPDHILRRERGQGKAHFSRSANHEQDWQPYPVDLYSAICDVMTIQKPNGDRDERYSEYVVLLLRSEAPVALCRYLLPSLL